ncbi:MAG TPA: ABC transporter permease [Bacillota bacterium]
MNYYLKKLGSLLVTLILVSLIIFSVFQILPGDPVEIILGVDADPFQVQALSQSLGLDKPVWERYLLWIGNALRGDLGQSLRFQQPVTQLISSRIEVTVALMLLALLLTIFTGIPLGIWLAKKEGLVWGLVGSVLSQIGLAVPPFWMGILLLSVFAVALQILPSGGYVSWRQSLLLCLKSLILPAVSISIGTTAVLVRYLKNTVLDQIKMDYVRTALSKGLNQNSALYRHVLKNALIPVVTILGMIIADILGGSIITENVFSLPGIGNLIAIAVTSRDFPLIQGLVLYLAVIVSLCNFLVDVIYTLIDPRIRLK